MLSAGETFAQPRLAFPFARGCRSTGRHSAAHPGPGRRRHRRLRLRTPAGLCPVALQGTTGNCRPTTRFALPARWLYAVCGKRKRQSPNRHMQREIQIEAHAQLCSWHRSQPPAGSGLPSLLESEVGSPLAAAAAAPLLLLLLLLPPPPRGALAAAAAPLETCPPHSGTTASAEHARREGSSAGRQR